MFRTTTAFSGQGDAASAGDKLYAIIFRNWEVARVSDMSQSRASSSDFFIENSRKAETRKLRYLLCYIGLDCSD